MNKKLRILYVIDSLKMGGAERITVALMPFLNEIEPIICTLYDHESPLLDRLGDVKHHFINANRLLDPGAFSRFLGVLKDERIDMVHAQLQHATVFAATAQFIRGIPFVATRHVVTDDLSTTKKRRLVRAENVALQAARQIVYVSNATCEHHQQSLQMSDDRYMTIYNGIELKNFQIDKCKEDLATELGFPTDKPLVVMVGVMRPGKGHKVAIDAAKQVPDVNFLLVGDGTDGFANSIKDYAKGVENVILLGTRKDVPVILNAVDMLILPSDMEALPTVLIEAGAAAIPAIASDVGGVTEIIKDGETGLVIPPQDPTALAQAIQRLVAAPALAEQMGKAAFDRIQATFTLENQARELTTLYERIVAESPAKNLARST